jgi:hypothetical protein
MKSPHLPLTASLSALAILLLAACDTRPDRKAMLEEASHAVPPMAANDTFFDGTIIAHLTLSATDTAGAGLGPEAEGKGKYKGKITGPSARTQLGGAMGESNFGGSFGGAAMGDMTKTMDGGGVGVGGPSKAGEYSGNKGMGGITDPEEPSEKSAEAAKQSAQLHDSELPPALLRLRLENTTQATLVVEVHEMNSELGNFAVRPDTLTLAPGQSAEPDPMESMLGLETYRVPVKVTLRAGGKTETKILTLLVVKPAADAPPPPAAN